MDDDTNKQKPQQPSLFGTSELPLETLELLRRYEALHFHLFPCLPRSKSPATSNGFKDASVDIRDWIGWLHEGYNLGLSTGPSGLLVIDYDPASGGDRKVLSALVGEFSGGAIQITGTGGQHEVFVRPADMQLTQRNGALKGIDLRGTTGYIMVAPSIHPNGQPYRWDCNAIEGIQIPALPANVADWINKLTSIRAPLATAEDTGELWLAAGTGRWNALQRIAGSLRRMGLGAEAIHGCLQTIYEQHCEPDATIPRKLQNITNWVCTKPSGAEPVRMRAPNGRIGTVPLWALGKHLDDGYELVDDDNSIETRKY